VGLRSARRYAGRVAAYPDRIQAGRRLAGYLAHHRDRDPLVLGVPRGGVILAAEVVDALEGDLGVVIARKVRSPFSAELAIGAVAPDGVPLLDEQMVRRLGIPDATLEEAIARAHAEVRQRQERYPEIDSRIEGRVVIVVDDGVATGSTLRAALGYVKRRGAAFVSCAVPVGPPRTVALIAAEVDEIVCPLQPDRFRAVGEWYDDFRQVTDAEVEQILAASG
jgi:putative phosphoribosyl transferase